MARFYFHFFENGKLDRDELGLELPDLGQAIKEAEAAAADAIRDRVLTRHSTGDERYEVSDEAGQTLFIVPLRGPPL